MEFQAGTWARIEMIKNRASAGEAGAPQPGRGEGGLGRGRER